MAKSDSYQWRIVEIPVDPEHFDWLETDQDLIGWLASTAYSDDLLDARAELLTALKRICKKVLTKRQKEIMDLLLTGMTQVEIGNKLGICQTSVHKQIKGNLDFNYDPPRHHGGIIKKLKIACTKDEAVLAILEKISKLKQEQE